MSEVLPQELCRFARPCLLLAACHRCSSGTVAACGSSVPCRAALPPPLLGPSMPVVLPTLGTEGRLTALLCGESRASSWPSPSG